MVEIITIGLDIAKHVFQVHGVDAAGEAVVRRQLRRAEVLKFFAGLAPCLVGMEACGSAPVRAGAAWRPLSHMQGRGLAISDGLGGPRPSMGQNQPSMKVSSARIGASS